MCSGRQDFAMLWFPCAFTVSNLKDCAWFISGKVRGRICFLLRAKRGAAGGLIVEKPLVIENPQGDFSDEIKEIYGEYYAMKGKA